MQSPWRHLSFMAQLSSLEQDGMQMPSLHCRGWGQSVEAKQVLGILTHSTSGFPVKSWGQTHCFLCRDTVHWALRPQLPLMVQGSLQLPESQTSLAAQFLSVVQDSEIKYS